jgi:hypothetical protein
VSELELPVREVNAPAERTVPRSLGDIFCRGYQKSVLTVAVQATLEGQCR